jgi:hypothetical protein
MKNDITAEVERVFHQTVQARKGNIRGTWRGQDGSGKEVILIKYILQIASCCPINPSTATWRND